MLMLDFSSTRLKAFRRGFAKGLAAPVMLYSDFDAPTSFPDVNIVSPARLHEGRMNVWETIGADFKAAITQYEQKNTAASAK